ncbi:MAG: ATP synthase F0 subunit C [Deltaproteobacteria bacterium]|nr:MAG: ATP synthase F0 subunit C [Deltaproteobacteria bacterium]
MLKKFAVCFTLMMLLMLIVVPMALASEGGESAGSLSAWLAAASAFAIAIPAFGGAIGQSRAISAALEGIARNPSASGKIQTPMIIGLALIESLVLYGLVIAYLLQSKI